MVFAIGMDDGSQWFRLFSANDSCYSWLEVKENNAYGVSSGEKTRELEAIFQTWAQAEKTKAVEALQKQGYKVVEVDSLESLHAVTGEHTLH